MSRNQLSKGAVFLVDLGCPVQRPSLKEAEEAGREGLNLQNDFGQNLKGVVQDSVDSGHPIYLGVSLPCLGLFLLETGSEIPQWHDWTFDPRSQRSYRSPYFSLFSLGYQDRMRNLLSELRQLKIAGIVFRDEVPLGLHDGMSPIAIKSFEEAFEVKLNPNALFLKKRAVRTSQRPFGRFQDLSMPAYPELFWKWAGWKARERLRVMTELVRELRNADPHLQFGLEIHPESLFAPVFALANFSEDWVDTAQAPFDFFVARFPNPLNPETYQKSYNWSLSNSSQFQRDLIQQMVDYLDDPQRVWVVVAEQAFSSDADTIFDEREVKQNGWPEGVGEILDIRVVP